MSIEIKHYPQKRICNDFFDVIEFLKIHGAKGFNKNWHWGRWEWLLAHPSLDESSLPSIGLFMNGAEIVGLVTHDMRTPAYMVLNPQYAYLKPQMVDYALAELSSDGVSSIFIDENDKESISVVESKGYTLTDRSEYTLALDCNKKLSYNLDDSFYFTDYYTDENIDKYVEVIHKGFENKGNPAKGLTEADFPEKPHENPQLDLFIAASSGAYAAHCGTWYTPDTDICYVEPVVTIPEYRNQGLGKAVVYECINRCARLGAKEAIVISNQEFYYRIGFVKHSVCRMWTRKPSSV